MLPKVPLDDGAPATLRPAILCLHGGGTNSTIFRIQLFRIQRILELYFEFEFLDAPFASLAGPGVHPAFDDVKPYLAWMNRGDRYKAAETDALIEKAIKRRKERDGRGFVGILGFSQGAQAAAGLLLEQQIRQGKEMRNNEGFRFGVFFNGITPPLTSDLPASQLRQTISYPTLHVVGQNDPWLESGNDLFFDHFDLKKGKLLEFDVDHRLPSHDADTSKITAAILRMYQETCGRA